MSNDTLSIALAQCNPTVGAFVENVEMHRAMRADAAAKGADLVVFPELSVVGYPPEDLVLRPSFQRRAMRAVQDLAADTAAGGPAMLVGGIWVDGTDIFNAMILLEGGDIKIIQKKYELPNYGVFDEARVFRKGELPPAIEFKGVKLGILLCEDTWKAEVARSVKKSGAELLISCNASPYETKKPMKRRDIVGARIEETGLPVLYLNIVGGQDEIVFDGGSFITDAEGREIARMASHESELAVVLWNKAARTLQLDHLPHRPMQSIEEAMYQTLVLGLKDYVRKTNQKGIILGISGGIDSALTAAIAVDALGKDNVRGLMLPSRYTSQDSLEDAAETAKLLGIRLDTIPIEPGVKTFATMLEDVFKGYGTDVTEENIQSRLRGNLLMALSNKTGWILANTGNKSEFAVGYTTLYGDLCGAYAVLKDVYKTQVFALAKWRNDHAPSNLKGPNGMAIPKRSITKAPSAELRENQVDQDSLPPYELLDRLLHGLVEEQLSISEVVRKGYPREVVEKVSNLLYNAEYKRRQSPPGVKVTSMLFGKDWRYPIAQRYKN